MEPSCHVMFILFILVAATVTVTGQDVKLACSGCDCVLRMGNTAYYCPGSEGILFFRCDVINQTAFTLLFNDGLFSADSRDSPISRVDDVFSIELRSVIADGLFANFTTFIWFDIADIMDNVSITCRSFEDTESMMIHPIDNPGQFGDITSQVSLLNSSINDVYIVSEWEYEYQQTVKHFVAVLSTNDMTIHQLSVPSNVRTASFVIYETQMNRTMASLTVTAVGYCGVNETKSIDIDIQLSTVQDIDDEKEDECGCEIVIITVAVTAGLGVITIILAAVIVIQCVYFYNIKKNLKKKDPNYSQMDMK